MLNLVKSYYEDFIPPWEWKSDTGKKKGIKQDEILLYCRRSQHFIAIVAVLLALGFDVSRKMAITAAVRDGPILFLMEILMYCILAYFIGIKRLPANYISFMVILSYVVLEKQYKPQMQDFQLKAMGKSRFGGHWTKLTYDPSSAERYPELPTEKIPRQWVLFVVTSAPLWFLSKFSKIDISNHVRTALLLNTVATSTAALLLPSSFAFEQFPDFMPVHRRMCEAWIVFATAAFLFIILFIVQRIRKLFEGKLKPSHCMRLHWESALFLVTFYVMLSYVPVIHKGFSTRKLLRDKPRMLEMILPDEVYKLGEYIGSYMYIIGSSMANANIDFFFHADNHK